MRRCDLYRGRHHEEEILQSFLIDILDKLMAIDLSMSQGSQETGDGKTSVYAVSIGAEGTRGWEEGRKESIKDEYMRPYAFGLERWRDMNAFERSAYMSRLGQTNDGKGGYMRSDELSPDY